MPVSDELKRRIVLYCQEKHRTIENVEKTLGDGTDGAVWETCEKTAVKVLNKYEVYCTELECYKRLYAKEITRICGYSVPRLIDYSHDHWAIEMNIVEPPRILDFGKVSLDTQGDFSQQTMAYWIECQRELWGSHWPEIRRILSVLRAIGIYYSDPNPYNITPENWDPEL